MNRTSNMIRHYMNLRNETSALLGKFVLLKGMLGFFRRTRCLGKRIYKIRIYSSITVYYMHRHETNLPNRTYEHFQLPAATKRRPRHQARSLLSEPLIPEQPLS